MKCPYCEREIFGMTGLQELQKFHKHLPKCKKNPNNKTLVNTEGELVKVTDKSTITDALKLRHESGQ